jgi:hypothetical protein
VIRRRLVELGERRQAALGEPVQVPAADAGDELARGEGELRDARGDHLLQLGDRAGGLDDAHLVPRVLAAADEVHVRVDESRDHRRAFEIDRARARPEAAAAVERDDAPGADRDRGRDAPARVHGEEAAVHEMKIARVVAGRGRREPGY